MNVVKFSALLISLVLGDLVLSCTKFVCDDSNYPTGICADAKPDNGAKGLYDEVSNGE